MVGRGRGLGDSSNHEGGEEGREGLHLVGIEKVELELKKVLKLL